MNQFLTRDSHVSILRYNTRQVLLASRIWCAVVRTDDHRFLPPRVKDEAKVDRDTYLILKSSLHNTRGGA